MSPSKWDVGACLAMLAIALTASTTSLAAERHNFILLIPEILPAASVEDHSAPTLTRLRTEGINFVNSHSGFPSLAVSDSDIAAGFKTEVLLQSVGSVQYFDAAGFPGWTVGIQFKDAPERWQWDLPWPRSMSVTISPD